MKTNIWRPSLSTLSLLILSMTVFSCVSASVTSTKVESYDKEITKIVIHGIHYPDHNKYMSGVGNYLKESLESRQIATKVYAHDSINSTKHSNTVNALITNFQPDIILEIKQLEGSFEWGSFADGPNGNSSSTELALTMLDTHTDKIIWKAEVSASAFNTLDGMQGSGGINKTAQKIEAALIKEGFIKPLD